MKICMILKSNFQMFQKDSRVLREAKALIESGYDVSVLLYDFGDRCKDIEMDYDKIKVIITHIGGFAEYHYKVFLSARKQDADIYHCHDFNTLFIGYMLKKILKKTVVFDSHELWFAEHGPEISKKENFITSKLLMLYEYTLLKNTDCIITVNISLADILSKRYNVETNKVHVLRNVSVKMNKIIEKDLLREDLNISKKQKIALYQGGLQYGRGLENLVRSWKYVNEDIVLVLIGYGQLFNKFKLLELSSKYKNRVYVKPAVKEDILLQYTKSADVGIHTMQNTCLNNYYCSPNKIFQYIIAGIPIIASKFPELSRIIQKDNLGLVVDPESPKDIADKINYLLDEDNKEIYNEMKQNCIRKGHEEYNWDVEKQRLINVYKKLVNS